MKLPLKISIFDILIVKIFEFIKPNNYIDLIFFILVINKNVFFY